MHEDINKLAFISEHADAVEMSFANSAQDVLTLKGFENLSSMLRALRLASVKS